MRMPLAPVSFWANDFNSLSFHLLLKFDPPHRDSQPHTRNAMVKYILCIMTCFRTGWGRLSGQARRVAPTFNRSRTFSRRPTLKFLGTHLRSIVFGPDERRATRKGQRSPRHPCRGVSPTRWDTLVGLLSRSTRASSARSIVRHRAHTGVGVATFVTLGTARRTRSGGLR